MTNRYKYLDSAGEHLHTLDGRPLIGTSRVGSILAKPLSWYGAGKAVEVFGCKNPKILTKIKNKKATAAEKEEHMIEMDSSLRFIKTLNTEQYAHLVDTAYRAHDVYKRERAKTGTDLHAECEAFVKGCMQSEHGIILQGGFDEKIDAFIDWSVRNVKRFLWSEGHCYSEKHWLGGISDAGYETKDGKYGILDFKSSKEAYMDQFWQCAGYAIQIEENGVLDADGNRIYGTPAAPFDEVCVFPFGGDKPQPYFNYDMAGSKEAFLAELLIYNKLPQD